MSVGGGQGGSGDRFGFGGGFAFGPEPGDDDGFVDFDPDAAIARIRSQEPDSPEVERRALEALEVLRQRSSTGPVPSDGAASVAGEGLPPAHWTRTPSGGAPPPREEAGGAPSEVTTTPPLPEPEPVEGDDATVLPEEVDLDEEDPGEPSEPVWVSPSDPRFETVDDPRIPAGREAFRIGEVARIVGVKSHVLRFWESEFSMVEPAKTSSNQRRFRRVDVAALLKIRRLRHDAKLTVAQTKAALDRAEGERIPADVSFLAPAVLAGALDPVALRRQLGAVRAEAEALLALVDERAAR